MDFVLVASSFSVCIWSGKSFQIQVGSGFNLYLDFIVTDLGRTYNLHKRMGQDLGENTEGLDGVVTLGLSKYRVNGLEMDFNLVWYEELSAESQKNQSWQLQTRMGWEQGRKEVDAKWRTAGVWCRAGRDRQCVMIWGKSRWGVTASLLAN